MLVSVQLCCHRCGEVISVQVTLTDVRTLECPKCSVDVVSLTPFAGYVYALSHRSMPGLLKIGMTTKGVKERVRELSSATGVPGKFTIEAVFESPDPGRDEKSIHGVFASHRVENTEFFKVSVDEAVHWAGVVCGSKPKSDP